MGHSLCALAMSRMPCRSAALIDADQLVALDEPWAHLLEYGCGTPLVDLAVHPSEVHITAELITGRRITRRAFSIKRVQREVVPVAKYRFYDVEWRLHAYMHMAVLVNHKPVRMGSDLNICTPRRVCSSELSDDFVRIAWKEKRSSDHRIPSVRAMTLAARGFE